jgi:hypothetical protein
MVVRAKGIVMPVLVTSGGECFMVNNPGWGILISEKAAA